MKRHIWLLHKAFPLLGLWAVMLLLQGMPIYTAHAEEAATPEAGSRLADDWRREYMVPFRYRSTFQLPQRLREIDPQFHDRFLFLTLDKLPFFIEGFCSQRDRLLARHHHDSKVTEQHS